MLPDLLLQNPIKAFHKKESKQLKNTHHPSSPFIKLLHSSIFVSTHLVLTLYHSLFCNQITKRKTVMAAIKVHGSPVSTAAMRVFACLNEKGQDFEFVLVDMGAGEHKKEHFLALNPFGQVPAFEDGDLQLFESRAITQYIARTYADKGNQLIYLDPKKMAIMSVWMEVEAHQFDPPSSKLTWELGVKPLFGMKTDEAVVEENEAQLAKVLDVYETRLSQSKYISGDSFTLADLHHLPNIQYLMGTQSKKLFDSRPRVSAWCTNILARPAWAKVVAMQNK